jgi:hypothetical protein
MAIGNRQIGWSQESNLLWQISYQMERLTGVVSTSGGGTPLITKTKSEIDALIGSNSLTPGQKYLITGVDVPLYGGTDIILQAASSNKLDLQGHGIFYNVNPDPIWTNKMQFFIDSITSPEHFIWGETVTGYNPDDEPVMSLQLIGGVTDCYNANYVLADGVDMGLLADISYIVGQSSGAIAIINHFNILQYNINDTVVWGGRIWKNLTGEIGSTLDIYTLDSTNWELVPAGDGVGGYITVVDEINYNYEADAIIYRKDRFNNVVSFNNGNPPIGNPIKAFQWGNERYVYNNKVIDSYFECINFGGFVSDNSLTTQSIIYNIEMLGGENSQIAYNTLHNQSSIGASIIINSSIVNNTLSTSSNASLYMQCGDFSTNVFDSSYMNTVCILVSSSMSANNLSSNSYLANNTLYFSSFISSNELFSSSIINNTLVTNSTIELNRLSENSSIDANNLENKARIYRNDLFSSTIYSNNCVLGYDGEPGKNSSIALNTLYDGSEISNNIITQDSYDNKAPFIMNNELKLTSAITANQLTYTDAQLKNNSLSEGIIKNVIFDTSGIIQLNSIFNGAIDLSATGTFGKTLAKLTIQNASVTVDISGATDIYYNCSKNIIYDKVDGNRLTYINGGSIVIAPINS